MPTFVMERVEAINAREGVYQLIVDEARPLENFEYQFINRNYLSEYRTILKYIEYAANGGTLPKTKLRVLQGSSGAVEYEFKSKHLRLYAIQQLGRKLILFIGRKHTQAKDIRSFRLIKKHYLDYKKQKENEKKRPA